MFLSTPADIAIYGGAAGGGKTHAILMEAIRYKNVPNFGGIIFRKHANQISIEGGLWDASKKLYGKLRGAEPRKSPRYHWIFPNDVKISFSHIERDENLEQWQGSEIAFIGFDELTHFTEKQFFYMMSRNRTTCGVKPYIRATCNPDADSWVAPFISWWINPDTGYPIPERSGKIRYMARVEETIKWGDTIEDVVRQGAKLEAIKSVTFIAATLKDNKILMETNPQYLANLEALPLIERERLLKGNWKIKSAAGLFFKRSEVTMIEKLPNDIVRWVRGWDLAATDVDEGGDPAYTAGVLIGKRRNGKYVIANVTNERLRSERVRKHVKNTAVMDRQKYRSVTIRLPKDPGQAGKEQAQSYVKMLAGFNVKAIAESGSKETRAEPFAAQWQAGNVEVLIAEWNEMYFGQLESFPESKFKDMVDASSSAFAELEAGNVISAPGAGQGSISKDNYWNGR